MGRKPASETIELRYGLHLFLRKSSIWQVYIKIPGENPIRRSLHTDQFDEAKQKAWREYDAARKRIHLGIPIRKIAFKDLAADYLLSKKNDPAIAYHRETIKRHFKPYFGTHVADFSTLTDSDIVSYLQWRRKKNDDEGIPLTNQTINRENVVLRQIIKHAVRRGYIPKGSAPTIESQKETQNPGREFTSVEFVKLRKMALSRIEGIKKADLLESRRLLFEFISFMVNTGLRPGEGKGLRWQDVNFDDRYISVAGGKTGSRQVVGRGYEMKVLADLRKRREAFAEEHQIEIKPSDRVFSLPVIVDGKAQLVPVKSFKTAFNNLLTACEFDNHRKRKHNIYSLRHTYATRRIEHGNELLTLAQNMGTSVRMIEQHYGHIVTLRQRKELTKRR